MARKNTGGSANAGLIKRAGKPKALTTSLQATPHNPGRERNNRMLQLDRESLAQRVELAREQVFKALSLIECCKYASSTVLDVTAPDYIVGVYDLMYDVLDSSAGDLGCIAEECRKKSGP